MSDFFGEGHRELQDRFKTRGLADALEQRVMRQSLAPMDRKFIAASDFFFLSTLDHNGNPTVSYKGGFPGFVRILDNTTLAFPAYDGNGMFYSMGNIMVTGKVGLLFIDFEQPRRLRLQGTARASAEDPLIEEYPDALMVARVSVEQIFTNCPRYVHRYKRVEASRFVPEAGVETPLPEWKRVDFLQENLPEKDRERAAREGPTISEAEYRRNFWKGLE